MVSFSFLAIFPYLFAIFTYIIFKYGNLGANNWWLFLIMTIVMLIAFTINYVITIVQILFKWSSEKAFLNSLIIKLVYVPVHCALTLLTGGLLNPITLVVAPVPVAINILFMGITGTILVISRVRFFLKTRKKLFKTVIHSMLSYFFGVDIIIAIVGYFETRKYERNLMSNKDV